METLLQGLRYALRSLVKSTTRVDPMDALRSE
jgi:hypothetical protein